MWFDKYHESAKHSTDDSIPIKLDLYKFGNYPSRDEFVVDWVNTHRHESHPVYELITDTPTRLYFDIEAEFPGPDPGVGVLRPWLEK